MKPRDRTKMEVILRRRNPQLLSEIESISDLSKLDVSIRARVLRELSAEFREYGLTSDDEPNDYGIEMESLMDSFGLESPDQNK